MSGATTPSASQLDEVGFISGIGADGRPNATNFQYWSRDTPATYTATATSPHTWGSAVPILYSFDPNSDWTAAEKAGWQSAMALWSAVADIHFAEVEPGRGNLVILRNSDGAAVSHETYSPVPVGSLFGPALTQSGTLNFDTTAFGSVNDYTSRGGFGIGTAVHELGHILGLGHGGPYNANVNAGTQQFSPFDSRLWTNMSYITPEDSSAKYFNQYTVTNTNWGGITQPFTWMPLDILAVQRLYGKVLTQPLPVFGGEATPLAGGQVFGFNCNISGPLNLYFNFQIDTRPVITLWDAGSDNTLDLSGFTSPSGVNLNPGTFSSCGGMTNNIAIAYDTRIDKAVGGNGDDTFIVNNDGDTINGGAGTNTVVFAGSSTQYTIANSSGSVNVTDSIAGRNGIDVLSNVRFLQFSNGMIDTQSLLPNAAQNGSNATAMNDIFRNSNPDPQLDWQMANAIPGKAITTAGAASGGMPLPSEALVPASASQRVNDIHAHANLFDGAHLT